MGGEEGAVQRPERPSRINRFSFCHCCAENVRVLVFSRKQPHFWIAVCPDCDMVTEYPHVGPTWLGRQLGRLRGWRRKT